MVAGELYLADDAELVESRTRARILTAQYNATTQDDPVARRAVLEELLGEAGPDVWIEPPFFCDYGWNIAFGAGVFLNFNCVVLDVAPVRVGEQTLIGPAVSSARRRTRSTRARASSGSSTAGRSTSAATSGSARARSSAQA